jgi:hypothetical protein
MTTALDSPLQAAKERLTIPELWAMLGLPGKCGPSCRSPFREDRNPSFSIYDVGRKWKDHATGEGGDVIDFLARALNLSNEDACRKLIVSPFPNERTDLGNLVRSRSAEEEERARKRKSWPIFHQPSADEIEAISELRGLSVEGVSLATDRELLLCANSSEGRAWIITDPQRINAQARLISGRPWAAGMKVKTLPGSKAASPVGLLATSSFPVIALVEGGPDFLAAFHLVWCAGLEDHVAPVAMFGASNGIPDDVLQHFAGKRVRVFQHDDNPGRNAGALWAAQLIAAGVEVDGYSFAGLSRVDDDAVKDLNDFAHVHPDHWESQRNLIEVAFSFALKGPPGASEHGAERDYRVTQNAA